MSLLIKGVKVPKDGEITIAFASDKNRENTTALILYSAGNQIENGNVVEIPTPHGRVIDADRLIAIIQSAAGTGDPNVPLSAVIASIKSAPTVIEAEK